MRGNRRRRPGRRSWGWCSGDHGYRLLVSGAESFPTLSLHVMLCLERWGVSMSLTHHTRADVEGSIVANTLLKPLPSNQRSLAAGTTMLMWTFQGSRAVRVGAHAPMQVSFGCRLRFYNLAGLARNTPVTAVRCRTIIGDDHCQWWETPRTASSTALSRPHSVADATRRQRGTRPYQTCAGIIDLVVLTDSLRNLHQSSFAHQSYSASTKIWKTDYLLKAKSVWLAC